MENFSFALQKFIDFALEVSNFSPNGTVSTSANPLHAPIYSYNKIFQETKDSRKHYEKFQEIYSQCKTALKEAENLEAILVWLKESKLVIQPKEGAKSKLPLSVIYRKCCQIVDLREDIEEPSILDYYREIYCYYLLKIFLCIETDEETVKILEHYVKQIKETLDIKDEDFDPKDPFSAMIKTCMNAAKKAGLDLPTGNINLNDLTKMSNDFLKGSAMEDTLVSLFKDMKNSDPNNPQELISNLFNSTINKLGGGGFPEDLQKAMQAKLGK